MVLVWVAHGVEALREAFFKHKDVIRRLREYSCKKEGYGCSWVERQAIWSRQYGVGNMILFGRYLCSNGPVNRIANYAVLGLVPLLTGEG